MRGYVCAEVQTLHSLRMGLCGASRRYGVSVQDRRGLRARHVRRHAKLRGLGRHAGDLVREDVVEACSRDAHGNVAKLLRLLQAQVAAHEEAARAAHHDERGMTLSRKLGDHDALCLCRAVARLDLERLEYRHRHSSIRLPPGRVPRVWLPILAPARRRVNGLWHARNVPSWHSLARTMICLLYTSPSPRD